MQTGPAAQSVMFGTKENLPKYGSLLPLSLTMKTRQYFQDREEASQCCP